MFYGSTHEKGNYPGTGKEPKQVGDEAVTEIDRRIVNRYLSPGPKSKKQFRQKWEQIIAEMKRFCPDLVIISAGFDAHKDDPLGGCQLEEEDYFWATSCVLKACEAINRSDPVPCISILEGGYNIKAISASAVSHCSAMRYWAANLSSEASGRIEGKASPIRYSDSDDAVSVIECERAATMADDSEFLEVALTISREHLGSDLGMNSLEYECGTAEKEEEDMPMTCEIDNRKIQQETKTIVSVVDQNEEIEKKQADIIAVTLTEAVDALCLTGDNGMIDDRSTFKIPVLFIVEYQKRLLITNIRYTPAVVTQ